MGEERDKIKDFYIELIESGDKSFVDQELSCLSTYATFGIPESTENPLGDAKVKAKEIHDLLIKYSDNGDKVNEYIVHKIAEKIGKEIDNLINLLDVMPLMKDLTSTEERPNVVRRKISGNKKGGKTISYDPTDKEKAMAGGKWYSPKDKKKENPLIARRKWYEKKMKEAERNPENALSIAKEIRKFESKIYENSGDVSYDFYRLAEIGGKAILDKLNYTIGITGYRSFELNNIVKDIAELKKVTKVDSLDRYLEEIVNIVGNEILKRFDMYDIESNWQKCSNDLINLENETGSGIVNDFREKIKAKVEILAQGYVENFQENPGESRLDTYVNNLNFFKKTFKFNPAPYFLKMIKAFGDAYIKEFKEDDSSYEFSGYHAERFDSLDHWGREMKVSVEEYKQRMGQIGIDTLMKNFNLDRWQYIVKGLNAFSKRSGIEVKSKHEIIIGKLWVKWKKELHDEELYRWEDVMKYLKSFSKSTDISVDKHVNELINMVGNKYLDEVKDNLHSYRPFDRCMIKFNELKRKKIDVTFFIKKLAKIAGDYYLKEIKEDPNFYSLKSNMEKINKAEKEIGLSLDQYRKSIIKNIVPGIIDKFVDDGFTDGIFRTDSKNLLSIGDLTGLDVTSYLEIGAKKIFEHYKNLLDEQLKKEPSVSGGFLGFGKTKREEAWNKWKEGVLSSCKIAIREINRMGRDMKISVDEYIEQLEAMKKNIDSLEPLSP